MNNVLGNLANKGINRAEWVDAGFSGQKYDDINRGKSSLKVEDIVKISEKFQLSFDYLLTGREKNPNSEILNENEREMLMLFRTLPEREQLKLIIRLEDLINGNDAWAKIFQSMQVHTGVPAPADHNRRMK